MSDEKHTPVIELCPRMAERPMGLGVHIIYEHLTEQEAEAKQLKAIYEAAPEMLKMLRLLEWSHVADVDGNPVQGCDICGEWGDKPTTAHKRGCPLSALIAKAEGKNA
jgi:hypothetical protein